MVHSPTLEAARQLVERYPVLVDAGDPAGVTALFAADGSLETATTVYAGRDEIAGFYASRLGGAKLHLVTDIHVTEASDGTVVSRSRFTAFLGSVDNPQLTWGTYEDRIVVDSGRARFKVRRITMDSAGPALDVWGELIGSYR